MSNEESPILSDAERAAILRNPHVVSIEEVPRHMGLHMHLKDLWWYGSDHGFPPLDILIRTRGGGQTVKVLTILSHPRRMSNGALCWGNIRKDVTRLLKAKEYAAFVNLLVEFLQKS